MKNTLISNDISTNHIYQFVRIFHLQLLIFWEGNNFAFHYVADCRFLKSCLNDLYVECRNFIGFIQTTIEELGLHTISLGYLISIESFFC